MSALWFAAFGYLSGSVLYARVFARLFGKSKAFEGSQDCNPGTFNAFKCVGFWCGVWTLSFDLLKGLLPVFLYRIQDGAGQRSPHALALVLAAPVIGHIYPLFFKFKGGKGIAVTFGCLLGLLPFWQPVAILALSFIFFSVVLQISPHFHRTLAAYLSALLGMLFLGSSAVSMGFSLITAAVFVHMLVSSEKMEKVKVSFLWIR